MSMNKTIIGLMIFLVLVSTLPFVSAATSISSCQALSSGTEYSLISDISNGNSACFTGTVLNTNFTCNGNRISLNGAGAAFSLTGYGMIEDCVIVGNGSQAGIGFSLSSNSVTLTLRDNSLNNLEYGIQTQNIFSNSEVLIYENTFNNIDNGIHAYFTQDFRIYENIFGPNVENEFSWHTGSGCPNNVCNIYENWFKSDLNVTGLQIGWNYNDTASSGGRIDGFFGNKGGNYYTTVDGDGFSETCNDFDADQICDDAKTVHTIVTDDLPLASLSSGGCSVLTGCYLDDNFGYTDTVLNHDWSGSSIIPVNSSYMCVEQYQENFYFIVPITESTGTSVLSTDLSLCSGTDGNEFYVSMGDESTTAFSVTIRDDGNIRNQDEEILGSFNTTCNNYTNYQQLKIIINFDNQPKTFDVALDDVFLSYNNEFTQSAQLLNELSWVAITSNIFSDYCNWSIDHIKLETLSSELADEAGETINLTAEFELAAATWGCFITQGADKGFNTDLCHPDEDANWCFLRCNIEAVGTFTWQAITNNILITLGFVVLLLAFMFMTVKFRK